MKRKTDHTKVTQNRVDRLTVLAEVAIHDLPILERLMFVRAILAGCGGDRASEPLDDGVVLANDVLEGVIEELMPARPAVHPSPRATQITKPKS